LVVWVRPKLFSVTKAEISIIPNVEITQSDNMAKLMIVLETKSQGQIAERLRAIEALQGVLNVSMISHYLEDTADVKKRGKHRSPMTRTREPVPATARRAQPLPFTLRGTSAGSSDPAGERELVERKAMEPHVVSAA
jgi:nitrate reductase NapAB chaperone NapD